MDLEKRVKMLEGKLLVDAEELPEGVFCHRMDGRLGAPPPEPVLGWRYDEHRIMRAEGESDDDLASRAFVEVKPFLGKSVVPVFYSIDEVPGMAPRLTESTQAGRSAPGAALV